MRWTAAWNGDSLLPSPYLPTKAGAFIGALDAEVKRISALRGELPAARK